MNIWHDIHDIDEGILLLYFCRRAFYNEISLTWKGLQRLTLETSSTELTALVERTLLPGLKLESVQPEEPVLVNELPGNWTKLGAGNYAGVFTHPNLQDEVVKVYAPGRPGWEDEVEVYRKLGEHPAYSSCLHAGERGDLRYLVLKKLRGKTFYQCLVQGLTIPQQVIDDIDAALDYARARGLYPHDVHGKNVMVSEGRGLVVDVSDFLKDEPCSMWDDLKKAYSYLYSPLMANNPVPVPEWVLNGVRKGYRLFRSAHS
jgi:hypothetical protein